MGEKSKYLIMMLLLHFSGAHAQDDFLHVDTLTYGYYVSGDWDNLILAGEQAVAEGTDYKFLRQRIGVAYFSKGDYASAGKHFKKALDFDSFDQFTIRYLYLSYLYTGKPEYAGFLAKTMTPALRQELSVNRFAPAENVDLEIGYTFMGSGFRSDAPYYRAGLGSRLGYRVGLYQSVSGYSQSVAENFTPGSGTFSIRQPEYYAQFSWNIAPRMMIHTGYHFLKTRSGSETNSGHMIIAVITPELDRFIAGLQISVIKYMGELTYQPTLDLGYVFPGRSSFYARGSMAWLVNQGGSDFIFAPRAGLKLLKKGWLEGNAAFGNLNLYNDYNGLYVYNSYDPLIMKAGATFTYFAGKKMSFWLNYSYGKKEYLNYSFAGYNQFSYLGGIKWTI